MTFNVTIKLFKFKTHIFKNIFYIRNYSSASTFLEQNMEKFSLPARLGSKVKSVWTEYVDLAAKYKPLNLGQGFPDFAAPSYVTDALVQVAHSDNVLLHQYTRGFGHPRLIAALSKLYSQLINRNINPKTEILVTGGAYEALYSAIMGHVDINDEVIVIEPFFDCYEPMVRAAGGIPKFIPLRLNKEKLDSISSADWVLDTKELENMFNTKTKVFILNTPNNPLGKVFRRDELEVIADLCKKWNVLCISDEVYEWMTYKPNVHVRIATLPGMWERTITIGSAGKTFSVTGWKTGWAYGPSNLMENLMTVHQNCVYNCNTPIQEAIAIAFEFELNRLGTDKCYFKSLPQELEGKRNYMVKFLSDAGMKPIVPEGGYFILADYAQLELLADLSKETDKYKDYKFTKWMVKNIGVQAIPNSAFFSEEHKSLGEKYIRFCFIKQDDNLKQAAEILQKWKETK